MRFLMMAVCAFSLLFAGLACEMEEENPDVEQRLDNNQNDNTSGGDGYVCQSPNRQFGNRCCSPEGSWGGVCKQERAWISGGGCYDEYVAGNVQYCCSGKFLPEMGAFGYRCEEDID